MTSFVRTKPVPTTLDVDALLEQRAAGPFGYPLLIGSTDGSVDLASWLERRRGLIDQALRQHGAVLFRGFGIDNAEAFRRVTTALHNREYNASGEHPLLASEGGIYSPVSHPAEQPIFWHNENSHLQEWPLRITFCCVKAPDSGGVTTLADSARVVKALDPKLLDRIAKLGIAYQRTFGGGLGLRWQDAFRSDDRQEVASRCRRADWELAWLSGDRLRIRWVRPGVVRHVASGDWVWFNQITHFHPGMLPWETRRQLQSMFPPDELPRNCWFGSGEPIDDAVLDEICAAHRELEHGVPWQRGDVLTIDNMRLAHARTPYTGRRQLLIGLGDVCPEGRDWWSLS